MVLRRPRSPKLVDAELADRITRGFLRVINRVQLGRRIPRKYGTGTGVLLTLIEAEICSLIARHEGITGSEIADELNVTHSATSQVIARLKEKGCIRQEFDDGNAKRKRLYLTPVGKIAADAANDYTKLMSKELYSASRRELQAYLRFVTKLEAFHESIRRGHEDAS